jgi:hypothetical protein
MAPLKVWMTTGCQRHISSALASPRGGEAMGGWYDAEDFGPGQLLGQIISGLASVYCR